MSEGQNVTVIGDGAVGLSAVLAAKRLGADRIILMGRHQARTDLGREFGATDVVAERGEEGIEKVRELTNGQGTHAVLECVGTKGAFEMAVGVVRAGGAVSRVGLPQYEDVPAGVGVFRRNVTITGGVAPARHYIPELLPDVLDGKYRAGPRLRPHHRHRGRAGRLPRHGGPRGAEGAHQAVTRPGGGPTASPPPGLRWYAWT